jgi:hypothetical protein
MGWVPQERFRGDPEHWVDAETFLRKGEEVMPILKANNRRLEEALVAVRGENETLRKQVSEINANMGEFLEQQKELLKEKIADQRTRILAEIRQAREDGDHGKVDDLQEALAENREQKKALEAKEEKPAAAAPAAPAPQQPPDPPEFTEWQSHNPWFGGKTGENARKTAMAMQFGREAAEKGYVGRRFFEYVDEQLGEFFRSEPPPSKSEGGRPSGQGATGAASNGSRYRDLPSEAKAQCDRDATRFVGPNKLFKSKEAWQAHFAEQFFV